MMPTGSQKSRLLKDYPDAKLLNRERKVINRAEKERVRKGTKHMKTVTASAGENILSGKLDKILCGDSAEMLRDFPDNCVDIIVTSPPYNFGLDYSDDARKDAVC